MRKHTRLRASKRGDIILLTIRIRRRIRQDRIGGRCQTGLGRPSYGAGGTKGHNRLSNLGYVSQRAEAEGLRESNTDAILISLPTLLNGCSKTKGGTPSDEGKVLVRDVLTMSY